MATAQIVQVKRLAWTALHQAVLDDRLHQVRILVAKHNVNVDCKDMYGRSPLMLACLLDNQECGYKMAKIFILAGAVLNIRDNMGRTALAYACMRGRRKIVRILLKEDILDINEPDNDGNTPLSHAAMNGDARVIEPLIDVLVKFGLSVDVRNSLGYTPLLLAAKHANFNAAYTILTRGNASPTLRDNEIFRNAHEWTVKSAFLLAHRQTDMSRSHANTSIEQKKRKLGNIYRKSHTPACDHAKSAPDPSKIPWDSGRLPAIFTPNPDKSEGAVGDSSPRQRFLDALAVTSSGKPRPRTTSTFTARSVRGPTSAKLLALSAPSRRTNTVKSDVRTLFKIYADQQVVEPQRPITVAGGESFLVQHSKSSAASGLIVKRFGFHSPIQEEGSMHSISVQ